MERPYRPPQTLGFALHEPHAIEIALTSMTSSPDVQIFAQVQRIIGARRSEFGNPSQALEYLAEQSLAGLAQRKPRV